MNGLACSDAFVVKLNPAGSGLAYATFLGGDSEDYGRAITVGIGGNALVTGGTYSSDFPTTPGAFSTSLNGGTCISPPCPDDAFVAEINSTGSDLVYSTFLAAIAVT